MILYQPCQYLTVMYTMPVQFMADSMGTQPEEALFYHGVSLREASMTQSGKKEIEDGS